MFFFCSLVPTGILRAVGAGSLPGNHPRVAHKQRVNQLAKEALNTAITINTAKRDGSKWEKQSRTLQQPLQHLSNVSAVTAELLGMRVPYTAEKDTAQPTTGTHALMDKHFHAARVATAAATSATYAMANSLVADKSVPAPKMDRDRNSEKNIKKCWVCLKLCSSVHNRMQHQQTCGGIGKKKCPHCNATVSDKSFKAHKKTKKCLNARPLPWKEIRDLMGPLPQMVTPLPPAPARALPPVSDILQECTTLPRILDPIRD